MSETAATLKRKASLSPPAQDVTSKRVKEDETTEGDSNVNTRSSSNRGVGEKSEVGDNTTPPAAPPKRESEPESTPLPTLTGSDVRGKSPEQTRRPSGSAAPASGPGPERDTGPGAARKSIALDEKKRAKRLFGGILGTLSQSQPSTHQRKRLDVDRRQQERVQKQREESDKIRADKLAKRKAIREKEQEKLEEEMVRPEVAKPCLHFLFNLLTGAGMVDGSPPFANAGNGTQSEDQRRAETGEYLPAVPIFPSVYRLELLLISLETCSTISRSSLPTSKKTSSTTR